VVGLERLETLRGVRTMLRRGGTAVYYDSVYQPIHVRLGQADYPSPTALAEQVAARGGKVERVFIDDLDDPRMQNAALLGRLGALEVIPGVGRELLEQALAASVPRAALEANLAVFQAQQGGAVD
jgi:indolepyruvate ferredoxin oxidoreductase beta subunit